MTAFGARLQAPPVPLVVVPRAAPSTKSAIVRPLEDEVPEMVGTPVARMAPVPGAVIVGAGGGRTTVKLQVREPTFPATSITVAAMVWGPAERVGVKLNPVGVMPAPETATLSR